MDTVLSERFTSLEAAVTSLLDSVKSINPSLTATDDLLKQNHQLAANLELLDRHQRNEQKIGDLRREADELDQRIKHVVGVLANMRNELVDLGKAAPQDKGGREVDFGELLQFAKNISRFTVAPTKPAGEEDPESEEKDGEPVGDENADDSTDKKKNARGVGWENLPEHHKQFIDHYDRVPFIPFPSFEKIKSGNLAKIQIMVDEGKDPALVPPPDPIEITESKQIDGDVTDTMMPAGPPPGHEAVGTVARDTTIQGQTSGRADGAGSAAPAQRSTFRGFAMYNSDED